MKLLFLTLIITLSALSLYAQEPPIVQVRTCGTLLVTSDEVGAAILQLKETKNCKNIIAEPVDNGYFVVYGTRVTSCVPTATTDCPFYLALPKRKWGKVQ